MKAKWMWMAPLAVVGFAAFAGLGGLAVMALWNWLAPTLFAAHTLTFWQALGLLALARILVGGFGPHRGGPPPFMRRRMLERWDRMSDDERARMREKLHARFGGAPDAGPGTTV